MRRSVALSHESSVYAPKLRHAFLHVRGEVVETHKSRGCSTALGELDYVTNSCGEMVNRTDMTALQAEIKALKQENVALQEKTQQQHDLIGMLQEILVKKNYLIDTMMRDGIEKTHIMEQETESLNKAIQNITVCAS